MAKNIVNLKIDGTSYSARPYGTCTTAAGTAAKAVTCADFSLTTGATILVKFTYANSVASPTLNVNSTGAKPIYYRGAALGSSLYYWGANDTVEFYYNGTQWDLMNVGNTNTTYSAATQSAAGLMSAADKKQLDGIAPGAEVNQNAFSNIKVGSTTVAADAKQDTVEFAVETSGPISISGDATNDKVTISHVKKGPSSGYTSGNTTTSISGSGGSGTIKIPQLTVDKYGHVTAAADESVTITMPTIPSAIKSPKALKFGSQSYDGSEEKTITAADLGLSSALKYHGTTTTAISDGSTTNPIVIGGSNHTASQGCVVAYGKKEFVWTGSVWEELGNEGNYKVVQTAVSSPSASGSATAFIDTISQDTNGKITVTKKNVSFPAHVTGPDSSTADHIAVFKDATGKVIKDSGYTIAKSVPSNAVFTDTNTKVTSAANHYTPTENTNAAISASGGSATNITGTSGKLNVVTGLKRDAKGHIVGVTSANIYSTDNNTTYGLANLESNGLMSATTFTSMAEDGAISSLSNISFETDPLGDKVSVHATQGVAYINYTNGESSYSENGVVGTIDIPAATTAKAGVMSAADKTKLNGIATGANKYTLPNATSSTLGGVKIGSNISVSSGTISLTKSNVTTALGYTPPTTNTTYSVATASTDGLMSKTTAEALSSYSPYTFLYDVDGDVTPGSDKVNVHWTQFCDYVDYSKNNFTENIESHYVDFDIPAATTTTAGVMSVADKMKFDQPFTGLVDGKGETVTMTSSPNDPIVPINDYLNLSLRALPGISVAFASYNSNAVVASPYLYKQAQRCAIVLDKSQLSTIDYQIITWKTSSISGYGTPWKPEQNEYSLIYIPSGYQSITFKHTGDYYNISAVGVHPTKLGGGYMFNGKWQYANEARTITLNNSDLYVILQAKKVDDSDIDPKLDVLSELGISITLNRSDNNICRGFVLGDGTQVYPVFKSAQNNDFNRICYYTNLNSNTVKPQLENILDCLAVYCHSLPFGYYKIVVQPPNNAREKYGVFDVLVSQDPSFSECKYLDVTAMINLNSVSDMSDLPFGHIWGQINTEADMAGAYSFQSMCNNEWVYKRKFNKSI